MWNLVKLPLQWQLCSPGLIIWFCLNSRHKLLNCPNFPTRGSPLHWAQLGHVEFTHRNRRTKTNPRCGHTALLIGELEAKGGRLYTSKHGQSVGVWYAHSNFYCWTFIRVLMMCHVQHEWIFGLESHRRKLYQQFGGSKTCTDLLYFWIMMSFETSEGLYPMDQ